MQSETEESPCPLLVQAVDAVSEQGKMRRERAVPTPQVPVSGQLVEPEDKAPEDRVASRRLHQQASFRLAFHGLIECRYRQPIPPPRLRLCCHYPCCVSCYAALLMSYGSIRRPASAAPANEAQAGSAASGSEPPTGPMRSTGPARLGRGLGRMFSSRRSAHTEEVRPHEAPSAWSALQTLSDHNPLPLSPT